MRVGFDARWYNDSGVGVYVAELLRAMASAGRPDFELVVYEDPLNPVPGLDERRVSRVAVSASKYSFADQFEFRHRSRKDRLDLFHSPFYAAPLALSCPLVVTIHDLIPFLFRIYPWGKQSLIKMAYRASVKRARHIIADSDNTARDLEKILGVPKESVTRVHIAASREYSPSKTEVNELECLRQKYRVGAPYVLVSSARNWRTKNLENALRALQIASERSAVKFQSVVYGPGDGIASLGPEERWGNLNLCRTGFIARPDLAMLFRHAHAFLMPSLYEGFGLPTLEAMSCGCPVLTSNTGALLEVAGEGAQVFSPGDISGMAHAVVELLQNPWEHSRWRVAALRRAADFSWSRAAEETLSVYYRTRDQRFSVGAS